MNYTVETHYDDKDLLEIKFSNIGPLEQANIKLNKLTIVTGENNVGKTYLTYMMYFFMNHYNKSLQYIILKNKNKMVKLIEIVDKLTDKNELILSFEDYNTAMSSITSAVISNFKSRISEFFNVDADMFKQVQVEIDNILIEKRVIRHKDLEVITMTEIKDKHYLISKTKNLHNIENIDYFGILGLLLSLPVQRVFSITAERLGIVLFRKELDARRSNIINQLQTKSTKNNRVPEELLFNLINDFTSRYSKAVHDNIDYARDMYSKKKFICDFEKESKISKKIERIMGGSFKSNPDTEEITFYSTRKNKNFEIPLHFASTSVRSLSLMFHYLKYQAEEGDLLFIDEPENHLSLSNQIELVRVIAQCINHGVCIFLTTHSDIMLKELNNLIKFSSCNLDIAQKFGIKLPYNKSMGISHSKVSLYQIEKGKTTKSKVSIEGIESELFDKVINKLNRNSNDIDFLQEMSDENF